MASREEAAIIFSAEDLGGLGFDSRQPHRAGSKAPRRPHRMQAAIMASGHDAKTGTSRIGLIA